MHHRALRAWAEGGTIDGEVVGILPKDKLIISMSRFRRTVGNPFREISL